MFPIRISPTHGGQTLPSNGGHFVPNVIGGWAASSGQALIIGVSQHLSNGQISIRILVLWICADFRRTFITTTNRGGQAKMCFTFLLTGIGKEKKERKLRFG